ncbi:5-oxoprolinase subunit PxpA [Flavobacteriaceae bacterium F08102]|nr:5-oxoprolinase subunit PxpA [Flavobacteriaceae bacterium F08102]
MNYIDLNCDLGEGYANEAGVMPFISSCNIACGGHAGDLETIRDCVRLALENGVKIGAHPSFADRENFGREQLEVSPSILLKQLIAQVTLVRTVCLEEKAVLHHIKAHGALYNLAAKDLRYGQVLIDLVKAIDPSLFLYVPYGSNLQRIAEEQGVFIKKEAFGDRNYQGDLQLVSRKKSKALLKNVAQITMHISRMVLSQQVLTVEGKKLVMDADTYCMHGDQPKVVENLIQLSDRLRSVGIIISKSEI